MASETVPLFTFYEKYLWGPVDFAQFQDAIVDLIRDVWGTASGAALLTGGAITPNGANASVNVAAFTAVGDDGYLHVETSNTVVAIAAGDPSNPRIDLIVARASNPVGTTIARPTPPGDTVTFTNLQQTQLVRIAGTPAGSPSIPAKVAGDVILGTVLVPTGWVNTVSGGSINQTTNHEIGSYPRFKSSAKELEILARSGNTTAIKGTGAGNKYGVHGVAGASGGTGGYFEAASGGTGKGIVAIGTSTVAALMEKSDSTDGASASDVVLQVNKGHIAFGTVVNPASTEPFTNQLSPKHIAKAFGKILLNDTTPVLESGLNITSVEYITSPYNAIKITLAAAMADTNGVVEIGQPVAAALAWTSAVYEWASSTVLRIALYTGTTPVNPNGLTGTSRVSFVVHGAQ